jgi:CRISPR-associated endonuclease Cas3-HD
VNSGFVHLLAKSTATADQPQEHESLDGHILGVLDAARTLLQVIGHQSLDSLALSSAWFEVLELAVARGALLHDLGKANDQFQRMVRGDKPIQALRHEWISLDILLRYSELDRWLFPTNDQLIRHAAVCAAVGHHLKSADVRDGSGQARIKVLAGHPDVARLLRRTNLAESANLVDRIVNPSQSGGAETTATTARTGLKNRRRLLNQHIRGSRYCIFLDARLRHIMLRLGGYDCPA